MIKLITVLIVSIGFGVMVGCQPLPTAQPTETMRPTATLSLITQQDLSNLTQLVDESLQSERSICCTQHPATPISSDALPPVWWHLGFSPDKSQYLTAFAPEGMSHVRAEALIVKDLVSGKEVKFQLENHVYPPWYVGNYVWSPDSHYIAVMGYPFTIYTRDGKKVFQTDFDGVGAVEWQVFWDKDHIYLIRSGFSTEETALWQGVWENETTTFEKNYDFKRCESLFIVYMYYPTVYYRTDRDELASCNLLTGEQYVLLNTKRARFLMSENFGVFHYQNETVVVFRNEYTHYDFRSPYLFLFLETNRAFLSEAR
jgi:hypothetical protein